MPTVKAKAKSKSSARISNIIKIAIGKHRKERRRRKQQSRSSKLQELKDLAVIQALTSKPSQPASSSGSDQNLSALQATIANVIQSQNNLRPTTPPAPIAPLVERPPARELRNTFLDRFRTPAPQPRTTIEPPTTPEPQNELMPPTTQKKKSLFSRAVGSLTSKFTGSAPTTATKPVAKKATPSTSPPKAPTRRINDRSTLNLMRMSPRGYSPLSSEEDGVFEPVGVQPNPLRFLGANPLSETVPRPPLTQNELQEYLPPTLSPNTVEKYRVAESQKQEMIDNIEYVKRKSDRKRTVEDIRNLRDPDKINQRYQEFVRNREQGVVQLPYNVASRRGGGGVNELTPMARTPPPLVEHPLGGLYDPRGAFARESLPADTEGVSLRSDVLRRAVEEKKSQK